MYESEVKVLAAQLCPILCDLVDYCPPGSSVHGILQARILQWVVISSLQEIFPDPGVEPGSPVLHVDSLPSEPSWKLCVCVCARARTRKLTIYLYLSIYIYAYSTRIQILLCCYSVSFLLNIRTRLLKRNCYWDINEICRTSMVMLGVNNLPNNALRRK